MIRILTDSTADFPPEEARALGVRVVPLTVNFGDEHYRDGVDIVPEEFYEKLAAAPKLPTTSQPSPELFLAEFADAKAAGDEVVCVLISSALSGTFQSAQIAREETGYEPIYLVDSKQATLGEQVLVRRAVQRMRQGFTAAEIAADLEECRDRVHLFALVDTLKYLHKGGRLPAAVAIAGGLLGIKPVIGVLDGKVVMADKARGLPGAYVAIFKQIGKVGGIDEDWPVLVGYTGKKAGAEPFMRYVTQNLHLQKPALCPIGPVIGVHAGPGAAGVAFIAKAPEAAE